MIQRSVRKAGFFYFHQHLLKNPTDAQPGHNLAMRQDDADDSGPKQRNKAGGASILETYTFFTPGLLMTILSMGVVGVFLRVAFKLFDAINPTP